MLALPPLTLSSLDVTRLERLMDLLHDSHADELIELTDELERGEVVEPAQIPVDVVTMNSRVRFTVTGSAGVRERTLCYPKDADGSVENVSVFAPVGSALLGLRVGQEIDWPFPDGQIRTIRVEELVYQPERAGDWDA